MQPSLPTALFQTELEGLELRARGKVRDIYDLGEHLLFVATDRLSAFDYVLPDPIPDKGKVLNQVSLFWFDVESHKQIWLDFTLDHAYLSAEREAVTL